MDNTNVGGNRGNLGASPEVFGTPESFEAAFETGKSRAEKASGVFPESTSGDFGGGFSENRAEFLEGKETQRGMGERVLGVPEFDEVEVRGDTVVFPGVDAETENVAEVAPLAMDGSTEGRLGKAAVSLTGELIDKDSEKKIRSKIKELEKKPYELSNYRDEEMAESLRDNFGRIFGNDDIGEIQVEEKQRAENRGTSDKVIDFESARNRVVGSAMGNGATEDRRAA